MRPRLYNGALQCARMMTIGALLYLYFYGSRIAVEAIRALPMGTETDPLHVPYPGWTILHFASALVFAVLAMFQLIGAIRVRYPAVHRYIGRIAAGAAYLAAISAAAIPLAVGTRPWFWSLLVLLQFVTIGAFLTLGIIAARRRQFRVHRAWMIRSIAFAAIVMTQRIVFPFFPKFFGIHSDYQLWVEFTYASLLATVINLAVAEWWLRSSFPMPSGFGREKQPA